MSFDQQKHAALTRLATNDKSRAGALDPHIKDLVTLINKHPDFYTTSSCAGRILIYEKEEASKKNQTRWLLACHEPMTIAQFNDAIKECEGDTWFAVEPVILHIAARTQESAKRLLHLCQQSGLKRGGAVAFSPRIVIEIQGVDEMCTIICKNKKLVIDQAYIELLTMEGNSKLCRNFKRIRKLSDDFLATFK